MYQKPISMETGAMGYYRMSVDVFHRKNWNAFLYLDHERGHESIRIFLEHRIPVQFIEIRPFNLYNQFHLFFCRVPKKQSSYFEACLEQLHTILMKEDRESYEKALEWLAYCREADYRLRGK